MDKILKFKTKQFKHGNMKIFWRICVQINSQLIFLLNLFFQNFLFNSQKSMFWGIKFRKFKAKRWIVGNCYSLASVGCEENEEEWSSFAECDRSEYAASVWFSRGLFLIHFSILHSIVVGSIRCIHRVPVICCWCPSCWMLHSYLSNTLFILFLRQPIHCIYPFLLNISFILITIFIVFLKFYS